MSNRYTLCAIAVISLVTAALRFLPFVIFSGAKKTPKIVEKLSRLLPAAVMGMLVVYCLRDVSFAHTADYLPALASALIVALLHIWRRNTLISILGGTLCYMMAVQFLF